MTYDEYIDNLTTPPAEEAPEGVDEWHWRFGPKVDGDCSVVVTTDAGTTMLVVDYDLGANRFAGGAAFRHLSGPELTDEALGELADDMQRLDGSQFIPIRPQHYRKEAA
jgi:hypothetical protein